MLVRCGIEAFGNGANRPGLARSNPTPAEIMKSYMTGAILRRARWPRVALCRKRHSDVGICGSSRTFLCVVGLYNPGYG
jgi:hypothetical protein